MGMVSDYLLIIDQNKVHWRNINQYFLLGNFMDEIDFLKWQSASWPHWFFWRIDYCFVYYANKFQSCL
jgi:hypothetical protein